MESQLLAIVNSSNLSQPEAKTLITNFGTYEQVAEEWKTKAEMIVVTDASQVAEMEMAKVARKKFSDMRIAIEKTRKELKEQSLRKGQAIDAIAKFLVSLISPIEEHLKLQENFIKIQEAKKAEEVRIEAEKKAAEELRLKLEAEEKELEQIRLENIRLQEEARKREQEFAKERAKAEADRRKAEQKAQREREEAEKVLAEEKVKAEAERMRVEEEVRKQREKAEKILAEERAKAKAERIEKEKIQKLLDSIIECPYCHQKLTKNGEKYENINQ